MQTSNSTFFPAFYLLYPPPVCIVLHPPSPVPTIQHTSILLSILAKRVCIVMRLNACVEDDGVTNIINKKYLYTVGEKQSFGLIKASI